jgi:transcriptional regulator with XRE-family HTH domain
MASKAQLRDVEVPTTDTVTKVKELLTSLNWSQSRLSRAAGVSQQAISLFLRGERNLSPAVGDRVLTSLKAEIAAREEIPESVARIRAKAEALLALAPPRDPVDYERWKERMLGKMSSR